MAVQNARPRPEDDQDEDDDDDTTEPALGIGQSVQAGGEEERDYENERRERAKNPARNSREDEALQVPYYDWKRGGQIVVNWGDGPYTADPHQRQRGDFGSGHQTQGGPMGVDRNFGDYGGRGSEHIGAQGVDLGTPDEDTDRVNAARLMGKRQPAGQDEDYLPLTSEITEEDTDQSTGAKPTRTAKGKGTDEAYCDDDDADYGDTEMYDRQGYVGQGHGAPPTQNVCYASAECLPVPGGWTSTATPGIFGRSS
jgi:hypothetical protein